MSNDNFFYRPRMGVDRDYLSEKEFENIIGPDRDYSSEKDFERIEEEITEEIPDVLESAEESKQKALEIVNEIEKIKKVINILPSNLPEIYRDVLNKIKHDIINPPPIPYVEEVPVEPQGTTRPRGRTGGNIIVGGTEDDPIYLFPIDNGVEVITEPVIPLTQYVRESFVKDKNDMYDHFVQRLKLMIQQYMRELLYVAKVGKFKSYLDLYVRFDTPSAEIPKDFQAAADRITKNQISRDSKTRLLNKIFNIDQTVSHLIANKAAYDQRQRYYDIEYLKAKDYVETQENDELRKQRLDYDKKYEQNMYNYYKYLTGAATLTDEILKTFLSEARGKALLHKNGIDTQKGYKEEQEKQKQVEAELKKETEEAQKKEEEKQKELLDTLIKAGRDPSYSGTYGDKTGVVNSGGGSVVSGGGGGSVEVDPVSGSNAEKIIQMALQAWNKRGPNSGNPIQYSMGSGRTHKIFQSNAKYTDCSGFVRGVVLEATGIDVGGYTAEQVNKNKGRQWVFNLNDLQPGDLVYFKSVSGDSYTGHAVQLNGKRYNVSHALIYLGNKECIECTRSSNGLRKFNFSSGWNKTNYMEKRFLGAFRL